MLYIGSFMFLWVPLLITAFTSRGEKIYNDLFANCLISSQGILNVLVYSNKIEHVKQSLVQCISSIYGSVTSNFKKFGRQRQHPNNSSSSNLPPESAATLSSSNNNRDSTTASAGSGPGSRGIMDPNAPIDSSGEGGSNSNKKNDIGDNNEDDDCIVVDVKDEENEQKQEEHHRDIVNASNTVVVESAESSTATIDA